MTKKPVFNSHYLLITILLLILATLYLTNPEFRLIASLAIGLVYFLFGILMHLTDRTLHLRVVLEYLSVSLIGTLILIFISLRA